MAAGSSRLAGFALILVAVWIAVYWATPAPDDAARTLRLSRGEPPEQQRETAPPARETEEADPAPVDIAGPPPAEQIEPKQAQPPTPSDLVPVSPEELEAFEAERDAEEAPGVETVPPTFRMYVSERGDTFQSIAREFYGSVNYWGVIARANPDVDPNRLGPGRRLRVPLDPSNIQGLPADGETQPDHPEPDMTEYIVAKGDTLSEIAQALYGRSSLWRRIADANPGVNPNRLRPGQVLKIPPPPAADE